MYCSIFILVLVLGPLNIKACPHLYYAVPYTVTQPVQPVTLQRPTMQFMQQPPPMQQMQQPQMQQSQMQQTQPVQQQTQQQPPAQEPQLNHQHQSDCDNKCNKLLSMLLKMPTDVATNLLSGGLPL